MFQKEKEEKWYTFFEKSDVSGMRYCDIKISVFGTLSNSYWQGGNSPRKCLERPNTLNFHAALSL